MKTEQPEKIQVQIETMSAQAVNQDQRLVRDREEKQELEGRVGPREVGNCEGQQGREKTCPVCGQAETRGAMERGLDLARDKDRNRKPVGQVPSLLGNFCWQIPPAKYLSFPFKNTELHMQNVKNMICIVKPHNSNEVFVQS